MRLRELAEGSTAGHGIQLAAELAENSAQIQQSDPAILGGLLRVLHTALLQAGPETVGDA